MLEFSSKFQLQCNVEILLCYTFAICSYLLFGCKINLLYCENGQNLTSNQSQITTQEFDNHNNKNLISTQGC